MKNSALLFGILFSASIQAQVGLIQIEGKENSITTHGQFHTIIYEVPIEGSPYVNPIYKKGTTLINGQSRTEALMRYDAYHDAVELLDENNRPRKLLRRQNIAASFDGKTYKVMEYLASGHKRLGYFNVLNTGKVQLLFKPKKVFVEAETPENGYDTFNPPTYQDKSSYYLKIGDSPAEEIKLKKRKILRHLDHKAVLQKYMDKYRLNLQKEIDVIRLLNYYNSLNRESGESQFSGPVGVGS